MGTKYSTILVGGVVQTYNDGPPADDGSQVEANRVKYVTVTGDLTAPLHSAIISMDGKLASFVDEGPTTKATAYTTVLADHNTVIECSGTFTLDLLAPSGNAGYKVIAKNAGSGVITVEVDGGGNVDGAASLTLVAGEAREFRVNDAETAYYSTTGNVASGPSGDGTFVDASDGGPYVSSAGIIITNTHTVSTWESVGPTGSGANNIWTALDSLPSDIDWIEARAKANVTVVTGTIAGVKLFARQTGSSATGDDTEILDAEGGSPNSGVQGAKGNNTFKVAVDSSIRFDAQWQETGTTPITAVTLLLTGYGYNR